jgi:hypothetical protein
VTSGEGAGSPAGPGKPPARERRLTKGWSALKAHIVTPPEAKPELKGWGAIMKMVVNKPTMGVSSRFTAPERDKSLPGAWVGLGGRCSGCVLDPHA